MISVLTCPRPGGVQYIDELLAALPNDTVVFKDESGYLQRPPSNTLAGWRAIEEADRRRDWLLFLEDDVIPIMPIDMAISYPLLNTAAFASLCNAVNQPEWLNHSSIFRGSQAVLFSSESIRALANFSRKNPGTTLPVLTFDLSVGLAGRCLGMLYEQSSQPYFRHVGIVSAADPRQYLKVDVN